MKKSWMINGLFPSTLQYVLPTAQFTRVQIKSKGEMEIEAE